MAEEVVVVVALNRALQAHLPLPARPVRLRHRALF
jgi:hypothetical protein